MMRISPLHGLLAAAGALCVMLHCSVAPADDLRAASGNRTGLMNHKQAGLLAVSGSRQARVIPAPIGSVTMGDGFWKRWMDANRTQGIPALYRQLEEHGVIENFRLVSGRATGERKGPYFTDSDLYKWMEGTATALESTPDAGLRELLETVIDEVAAAQRPDGYVNTFFTGEIADERFRNLGSEHELYCAGHMFQAAVAHYRATGETTFLDVATRFADYLVKTFGPGKIEQPDGHPEIEMALIELFRVTGEREYLDLAGFFLRKQDFGRDGQISGHAVRAAYLVGGAADYYLETGEKDAREAAEGLWRDMATGRVYITGGLGARHAGEAIGDRYELPNESAYAETCAAIANGMWNFRMLAYSGEARFADMLERALYNNVLSGISLDTTHWFYVNPLACFGEHRRLPWYGCTCCPTNVVRTLAAIPGYMYGVSRDGVWVHLYDDSRLDEVLPDGRKIVLEQKTDYPWDGKVEITVSPARPSEFSVFVRIPAWCRKAVVKVDGEAVSGVKPGSYLEIRRPWTSGDRILLSLDMPVEMVESDPRVRSNLGSVAVQRGPVVFCAESVDNPGLNLRDLALKSKPSFRSSYRADLLGGVVTISARAANTPEDAERGPLYRPVGSFRPESEDVNVTLIPYYAWANRGDSHMVIWMPREQ